VRNIVLQNKSEFHNFSLPSCKVSAQARFPDYIYLTGGDQEYKIMVHEPEFRYKQCLVIRNDVKMSCGKRCAQAAHASIGAYNNADKSLQKAWVSEGQKKVVLKANDERTLHELKVIAGQNGISSSLVQDAGMTEIPPGTITALGLGPAKTEDLDKITGTLTLL
jgi:PTH2 family peptidyl-tRNA hydrolase